MAFAALLAILGGLPGGAQAAAGYWEPMPERMSLAPATGPRQLAMPQRLRPVRLQSGTFTGVGEIANNLAAATRAVSGAGTVHVLLQFEAVPDAAERDRLAAAGVRLLGYVPEGTFFAALPADLSTDALAAVRVRWLGKLYVADKLSSTLLAGQPGVWALEPDGRVRLRLKVFEDVSPIVARAAVQQAGAEIVSWSDAIEQIEVRAGADAIGELAELDLLRWIEEVPPPIETFNDGLRTNLNLSALAAPPYALTGQGVVVGIWDAGWLDFSHPDFAGRVHAGESSGPSARHFHATHVAGTLAGDGSASETEGGEPGQWRGVAPGARLASYDVATGPLIEEHRDAWERFGAVISQNSWGITLDQFFGNCHLLGNYHGDAPNYDRLVRGLYGVPYHVVFAVGNARGRRDSTGCPSEGYRTVGVPATAKNVLAVGAINSDDNSMTVFSGWGPTDDGRLKPELVAPGDESGGDGGITSTQPDASYGTLVGTSMAAPAVSGAAALLIEDYRAHFNGQTPLPATVRGLLLHTAMDLDDASDWFNPGPDFASGYGRAQVQEAVDQLRAGGLAIGQVTQGQIVTYPLPVSPEAERVKLTLVWDDPPAVENAERTLVNDLDLIVTDPAGVRHYPWTLDAANPAAPALRVAEDHVNNVEQVEAIGPLVPGVWTISVAGGNVPVGPFQKFTLLFTPAANPQWPLLVMEAAEFSDRAEGNDNGVVDRGETVEEFVVFRNTDGPTAPAGTGTWTTDSPGVRILQDTSFFPEIRPGEAVTNAVAFRYRVGKDAACGQPLLFQHVLTVGDRRLTNTISRVVGHLEITNTLRETFLASEVPLPLPDQETSVALLPLEQAGIVLDVNAMVRLDHTYLDDLEVTLRHPSGKTVTLVPAFSIFGQDLGQGDCGPEVAWTVFDDAATASLAEGAAPFVGRFRAAERLDRLNQERLEGDWELVVTDRSAEDAGTLQCWGLDIEYAVEGYLCDFVNRPPRALDQEATFYLNRADTILLLASDPDDDPLRFQIVTPPGHGTLGELDPDTGRVTYLPEPGYLGPDEFTFAVEDGYSTSAPGAVRIEVRPGTSDLAVTQSAEPLAPVHGVPFNLVVQVTNHGPSDATAVVLTNTLPPGVTLLEATPSQGIAESVAGETVCQFGGLREHEAATLILRVLATEPAWATNHARAGAAEIEPVPENNASALAFAVLGTADLSLVHAAAADPTPIGLPFRLLLAVTNAGPDFASNVVVRSVLAPGLEFVSADETLGGWSQDAGVFEARLGDLEPAQGLALEFTVIPHLAGTITNLARVASDLPDPEPDDNEAMALTTVRPIVDLALTGLPMAGPVAAGQVFTNVLVLANLSTNEASEVTALVNLDGSVEFVGAKADQGTVAAAAAQVIWSAGGLNASGEARLELALRSGRLGWITNRAEVAAYEFDLASADNQAEIAIEVRPDTDLALGVAPPSAPVIIGHVAEYSLTVTNLGPNAATAVVLVHDLPPLATPFWFSASQGIASLEQSRLTVAFGDLPLGTIASLDLAVIPGAAGRAAYRAEVAAFEVDLLPANNLLEAEFLVEEHADLGLQKHVMPAAVLLSREASYTLVVTNQGPYAASGVQATDSLPEGLELRAVEASQGAVAVGAGSLDFFFGDLAVGSSATGWVWVAAARVGWLTNTAAVLAQQSDLFPENNAAEARLEVLPAVDLGLSAAGARPPVVVGRETRYSLSLTNRGPLAASAVRLVQALPDGVEFVAGAGPVGDWSAAEGILTCDIGEVPAGAGLDLEWVMRPTRSDEIRHRVDLYARETDLRESDNTLEFVSHVLEDADLAVTCAGDPGPLLNGESWRVLVLVTNRGPYRADAVQVENILPSGVELREIQLSQGDFVLEERRVMAHLGELEVGQEARLELRLLVRNSGLLTNLVHTSSDRPDLAPLDNACEFVIEAQPAADLLVSKRLSPLPAALGQPLHCVVTVTNQGPDGATAVQLTETLAAELEFAGAATTQGDWSVVIDQVRWNLESLTAGAAATLELILNPVRDGTVTNRTVVVAHETDPVADNNALETEIAIRQVAELELTLSGPEPPVVLGTPTFYRFTLRNLGPAPATGVEVRHVTHAGFRVDHLDAALGEATVDGDMVQWTLADLAAEGTATLDIAVTPLETGPFVLSANASAYEADLVPANNTVETAGSILGRADLVLGQRTASPRGLLGEPVSFELSITNQGPETATGIVITNELPPGLVYLPSEGPDGESMSDERIRRFALGDLAPGEAATVAFQAVARELGLQTNSAVVYALELDRTMENNRTEAVVVIEPAARLGLSVAPVSPVAFRDQPLRYVVTLTNAGPSVATGLRVPNPLPPGTEFAGVEFGDGSYALEGSDFSYEPGFLDPGNAVTFTLILRPIELGWITNRTWVVALEADPDPADNLVEIATEIRLGADLTLAIESSTPVAAVGEAFEYLVTVTNRGPHTASHVSVRNELPGGARLESVATSQGEWLRLGDTVFAELGELPALAQATVRLRVVSDEEGSLAMTASASSPEFDLNPADNETETLTEIREGANLAIGFRVGMTEVVVGGEYFYVLALTNRGPVEAIGVTVTNRLPVAAELVSVAGSPGQWIGGAGQVTCELGIFPAGAVATARVTLKALVPGELESLASVSALSFDPQAFNNQATLITTVHPKADLQVLHEPTRPTLLLSNAFDLALTVTNRGTTPAPRTDLLVAFSVNVEILEAELSRGEYSLGPSGLVCSLGDLAPAEEARLVVTLRPTSLGLFVSQATLFSPAGDPTDPGIADRLEATVVETPELSVARDATRLLISWPAVASGFQLESLDDLSTTTWLPVLNPRQLEGDRFVVNLKLSSPTRFFRLRSVDEVPHLRP